MPRLNLTPLLFNSLILLCTSAQSLKAQKHLLDVITPDQVILQYAGSIGYMSAGIGYNLLKDKTTLSFHYGYVPEPRGGSCILLRSNLITDLFRYAWGNSLSFIPSILLRSFLIPLAKILATGLIMNYMPKVIISGPPL